MVYATDLAAEAASNNLFRKILETTASLQLGLMTLVPGETTGVEKHTDKEQMFFVVSGELSLQVGGVSFSLSKGGAAIVPRSTFHEIWCERNAAEPARLFTLYSTKEHDCAETQERSTVKEMHAPAD